MGNFLIRYWHKLKKLNSKAVIFESIIITGIAIYIIFTTHDIIPFVITAIILIIVTANLFYKAYSKRLRLLELLLVISTIFILAGMLLPSLSSTTQAQFKQIECASNLKQIGTALYTYAGDNNGHFPDKDGDAGFEMLVEQDYLSDYAVYLCPSTMNSESKTGQMKSSYIFHGGLTTSSPEKTILAQDKLGNHQGYSNYLYCDGSVKGINDPNYRDPAKEPVIYRLIKLIGWR